MFNSRSLYFVFMIAMAFPLCGVSAEVELAAVKGKITLDGKPIGLNRIFFHLKDGQFVGCVIKKDGTFKIDRVPVGSRTVTIEATIDGKPLPRKYRARDDWVKSGST